MATNDATVKTYADWAKGIDPDGKTAKTVEMLSETNEMLGDMLVKEGNLPTGEQTTIRTGLPEAYYRLSNQGTPNSKSTKAQITENAAELTARSQCDVKVAKLNGDVKAFRMDEDRAFMEAMNQRQQETMIYGSAANPEEYVGFANRYGDLSAVNAVNIIDAGGISTDNLSIYLVGWGLRSTHGVFPKGSKAGLSHEDLGIQDALDENNNRYRAYMSDWKWENGLVVKDWRYNVRIANVDVSDLEGQTGTQAATAATAVIKLMSRAIDRLPTLNDVKPAFYVNRTLVSLLRIAALDKSNQAVTITEAVNQFGDTIFTTRFLGIPVRVVDALLNTEAQVV
jgi:hypothetical protein